MSVSHRCPASSHRCVWRGSNVSRSKLLRMTARASPLSPTSPDATAGIHNDGPPEALPAEVDRAWRAVLAAARPAGGGQ